MHVCSDFEQGASILLRPLAHAGMKRTHNCRPFLVQISLLFHSDLHLYSADTLQLCQCLL